MANQGAGRNPQGAGERFVSFTRAAANRIAKVVRTVEGGDRGQDGVSFGHDIYRAPARLATFTGAWATGTYKTVTLVNTTNTASVFNFTTPVVVATGNSTCSRYVVFTKAGGTNVVLEVQMQASCSTCVSSVGGLDLTQLTGYSGSQIQILGHDAGGCLTWYSVTTCATT